LATLESISSCLNADGTWSDAVLPDAQRIGDACLTLLDCLPCQWRGDSGPGKNDAGEAVGGSWGGFRQSLLPRMLNMTALSSAEAKSALCTLKLESENVEHAGSILNKMLETSAADDDNTRPGWPALAAWLYAMLGRALLSPSTSGGINSDGTGLPSAPAEATAVEPGVRATAAPNAVDEGAAKVANEGGIAEKQEEAKFN
jgi:hypothetical protein